MWQVCFVLSFGLPKSLPILYNPRQGLLMGRIEKTVFISYRRANLPWALFIWQNLTMHGYDVFFDYQSVNSQGDLKKSSLSNLIKSYT